ncbi:MAG: sigma 54-interacting transcriptional regulator [Myxococcales bacterium]|nr:sigma 54-interacting transcriptional regulator [Myxococcales bacterium]MDD9969364.1 sigma 54-interacting transcriptional regulator [Myxococcales bacterium]
MSKRAVRDTSATLRNTPAVTPSTGAYGMLAIVNGVVTTHALPESGTVTIGRARESDIQVVDASVSRLHARLNLTSPITLEDLGSANGTRVRGQLIEANKPVALPLGESMELGAAMIMVQQRPVATREWRIWAHGYFEGRLEDECARASRGNGTFGLLRVNAGDNTNADVVQQILAHTLRADDVVGLYGPAQYEVLLIDRGLSDARTIAQQLGQDLGEAGVEARVGLATFPADGRTADRLTSRAGADASGEKAQDSSRPGSIVIKSPAMRRLVDLIERVAPGEISVLILGETGAGKEVMAEEVHRQSPRRGKPFLRLNCAALSETLLESELFGHERGSFTGASQAKAGLLETAQGGTVFLDEIGELPMSVQVKLLRMLEERKVWRVGGVKPRDIDVRFVAATNRNLEEAVAAHTFRQDLYFRLNGVSLHIPPLRERQEEIEDMAREFIGQVARRQGRRVPELTSGALELMRGYSWPGNVRELRNAVERAVLLAGNGPIEREHFAVEKMSATVSTPIARTEIGGGDSGGLLEPLPQADLIETKETMVPPPDVPAQPGDDQSADLGERLRKQVMEVERQHIVDALARCGGNQTRAAKELGISRRTLISRLEAYNIPRPLKDRKG